MSTANQRVEITDVDTEENASVILRGTIGALSIQVVDASGNQITDFTGGTEYSEDAATPATISGTATLIERDDALTSVTPVEGDWIGLRGTAEGALWTQDFNSDSMLTALQLIDDAISGNEMQVDVITVPAPLNVTGGGTQASALRVTIASDSTGVVSVDDNGGSLTVDSGAAFTVQEDGAALTALQLIDNFISGSRGLVTEDNSADILTAVQLIDNPVFVDDAAFTPGTSSVMVAGFEFDDTTPDSVNEGDAGAARMSANRNIYTTIRDAAGNERGVNVDASNNLQIDIAASSATVTTTPAVTGGGTEAAAQRVTIANDSTGVLSVDDGGGALTVDNAGTFAVQVDGSALTALQLIDNTVAVLGTATYAEATTSGNVIGVVRNDTLAALAGTDNEIAPLQVNASGALYIQEGAAMDVSAATVTVDLGANNDVTVTSTDSDGLEVQGGLDHDAVDAGSPLKIGGRSQAPTAALEEVADNDRVDAAFDRQGRQSTWMGYPVLSAIINDSSSGDNTIQAAAGAGLRIAVLGCVIVSDGTTDVRWEDGAGGTAFTGQIPLQAREGFVMPIGPQPWFVGAANTLLNLELTAAVNVHGIVSYVEMTD